MSALIRRDDLIWEVGSIPRDLELDAELFITMVAIGNEARKDAIRFQVIMASDGKALVRQKRLLQEVHSVKDLNLDGFGTAMHALLSSLDELKLDITHHQTRVYVAIEQCRNGIKGSERKIADKRKAIDGKKRDKDDLDNKRNNYVITARIYEAEHEQFLQEERRLLREQRERWDRGILGLAVGTAGTFLAVATGGASLVATGILATGAFAGYNLHTATGCAEAARERASDARRQRDNAGNMKRMSQTCEDEMKQLEQAIQDEGKNIEKIQGKIRFLEETNRRFSARIQGTDAIIVSMQDMVIEIKRLKQSSKAMKTFQNAFCTNPEKLNEREQAHLQSFKEKWDNAEQALMRYGGRYMQH